MIIAGLQKLSLIDYPGSLAAAVFLQGCNFRCGYCHNPDLIPSKGQYHVSEGELFDYLSRRIGMIEGVVITGGEPTLQEDLPELLRQIKSLGFKVKLDTNGSNPAQIEDLLRKSLLDFIAVDVKTAFDKYSVVNTEKVYGSIVLDTIRLVMLSLTPYELRTTCVPGIVDAEDLMRIGDEIKGAEKYCLQQFRPENTFKEDFMDVKPYSAHDLKYFQSIMEKHIRIVETRGI